MAWKSSGEFSAAKPFCRNVSRLPTFLNLKRGRVRSNAHRGRKNERNFDPRSTKILNTIRSNETMMATKMEAEESLHRGVTRPSRAADDGKSEKSMLREEGGLSECKYHSLVLGVVIGCFIQLSCMGAFFVYSKLTKGQEHSMWTFSLTWSAFTSLIGLGIMVILSVLFRRVSSNERVLMQLELYVSSGAVIGVSFTWLVKNVCTGVPDLVWRSLLSITLTACYVFVAKKLVHYSAHDAEADQTDGLSKPLLETPSFTRTDSFLKTRRLGYALGSLIGCFVQTSSLAAHHIMLQHREMLIQTAGLGNSSLVLICVLWDLVICSLGVASLLLVRKLMLLLHVHSPTYDEKRQLFVFEACFCTGALFGVNICWMVTDMLLGLHDLLYKTMVTLTMSLLIYLWNQRADENEDAEDNEEV